MVLQLSGIARPSFRIRCLSKVSSGHFDVLKTLSSSMATSDSQIPLLGRITISYGLVGVQAVRNVLLTTFMTMLSLSCADLAFPALSQYIKMELLQP